MGEVVNLWNQFNSELRSFIFYKTRNESDTDDILQEVFMKIIQNISRINEAKNVKSYIYAIVRNTINDHFRKNRKFETSNEIPEIISEEESTNLNQTIADCCLRPLIETMSENYRDALIFSELEEKSQKELAEEMSISYSGAKSRVQRAKEKLKSLILENCAGQSDAYGNLMDSKCKAEC